MALANKTQSNDLDTNKMCKNSEIYECSDIKEHQQQQSLPAARHSHHIDFITKCPYDILCCILDHFTSDIDTIIICAAVCRNWRDTLFQCHVPWRVINTWSKYWTTSNTTTNQQKLLNKVSKFVEKIFFRRNPGMWERFAMTYFQYFKFTNLWFLEIWNTLDNADTLYDALACISGTLLELRLFSRKDLLISVTKILSTCPHLRSLYCKLPVYNHHYRDKAERIKNHNSSSLVNLIFYTVRWDSKLTYNNLMPILEQMPHLQSLSFGPLQSFDNEKVLSIMKHCPKLKAINTGFLNSEDIPDHFKEVNKTSHQHCRWINIKNYNSNEEGQLNALALGPIQSMQPFKRQLERSYTSLQCLCLSPSKLTDKTLDEYSCWEPLLLSVMPNLTKMHIVFNECPLKFREQLPDILNNCPNLDTLRLHGRSYDASRSMLISKLSFRTLEAIVQLKHLSHLQIQDEHIDSKSLSWLIEHCSTKIKTHNDNKGDNDGLIESYSSTLRKLNINICTGRLSSSTLPHISRIRTLEMLDLFLPGIDEITALDIVQFSRMLARLPRLTSLRLGYVTIEIEAARYLVTSKSLSNLHTLNVKITEETVAILKKHIKNVLIYNTNIER